MSVPVQSVIDVRQFHTPSGGVGPVACRLSTWKAFNFDFEVSEGEDYVIDPFVAIGYEYVVGAGDPLFESVMIPLI